MPYASTPPPPAPPEPRRSSRPPAPAPNFMHVSTSIGLQRPTLSTRPPLSPRPPADDAPHAAAPDDTGAKRLSPPPPPENGVVAICDVPPTWKPDATLNPAARNGLREQLFPLALDRCFVVVVTGPNGMRESKSRVAAELALSLAEAGHPRILLMDANFHRPRVHSHMQVDIPVAWGFSQQLHARVHGEIVQGWAVLGCTPTLHVLGESMFRSPGMLLSKQFEDSMRELKTYYDIIVVDAPDLSFDLDCRALDVLADGIIVVTPPNVADPVSALRPFFSSRVISTVIAEPLR